MNPKSNDALLEKFGASRIEEILVPDNPDVLRRSLKLVVYKLPWLPDFVYRDMFELMRGDVEGRLELVDGIIVGKENAPPLPKIEQDVLIIWGDKDQIFNIQLAHQLQEFIGSKARLEILKEVGHVPAMEKAKEFNRLLLDFLQAERLSYGN